MFASRLLFFAFSLRREDEWRSCRVYARNHAKWTLFSKISTIPSVPLNRPSPRNRAVLIENYRARRTSFVSRGTKRATRRNEIPARFPANKACPFLLRTVNQRARRSLDCVRAKISRVTINFFRHAASFQSRRRIAHAAILRYHCEIRRLPFTLDK